MRSGGAGGFLQLVVPVYFVSMRKIVHAQSNSFVKFSKSN